MRKEKDKTIEDFMEEVIKGIWAVIQFSLWPVKASYKIGGLFENIIRSLVFYSLLLGVFFLYCFAHKKDFSQLNFLWFFYPRSLNFSFQALDFIFEFKQSKNSAKTN